MITVWDKDKFEKEEIDFYNDFHDDEKMCKNNNVDDEIIIIQETIIIDVDEIEKLIEEKERREERV